MLNILSSNYLARFPVEKAMKEFGKKFGPDKIVLDIGCGKKPYAKYFNCKYVGLDPQKEVNPDIIADSWDIPVNNNYFDGIILNQSLEHIAKTQETILEIKRILKPGGLAIITVPQTMKNHSIPIPSEKIKLNNFDKKKIKNFNIDYYRFTKFGLLYIFRDFKIIEIKETSGYFATICQLINYFFSSFGIKFIFTPIYFTNNILGLISDFFFGLAGKINTRITLKLEELIYKSLTLDYILIIKKW
ncbi:MAG: methyltransferase domain-containing protein [Patescibacteria group bacterium]